MPLRLLLPLALAALLTALPAAAHAQSAPDHGRAFSPAPQSTARYAVKAPADDPARQQHVVEAADGVDLFVETWLPAPKNGATPPARLPTILVMTPYVTEGGEEYPAGSDTGLEPGVVDFFVSRGYAVAQHHVRGTGSSGGCLEQTAANQIEDGARVVEYLGRDAPWADGNVGMYGISYDAETQISVAGLGDPAKTKYLKAIVPAATVGGQYEYSLFDGVPYAGQALLSNTAYLATTSLPGTSDPTYIPQRLTCQPEIFVASSDLSGDMTPFWQAREYRPGAPKVKAATLMVHGLADFNVDTLTLAGFFDRLPATTPHKGLFGVWEHAFPHRHDVRTEWQRADWYPMALAWYDRYLKGLGTGVEQWPAVQVQDTAGQWRAEPEFPTTGGPVGQLALSGDGTLGSPAPTGEVVLRELTQDLETFTTAPVRTPLHLTGQPVLDLWLTTSQPDGHLAAELQVLDAAGDPIEDARVEGFRSLRHLDPLVDGRFAQAQGKPAPANTPIRVPVRFQVTDLRVPQGGRLQLSLGTGGNFSSVPSGANSTITVLTGCERASALRFLMPRAQQDQLDVREQDEASGALGDVAPRQEDSTGGGLATGQICGQGPERLSFFGPEITVDGGGGTAGGGTGQSQSGAGDAPATTPPPASPQARRFTARFRVWASRLRTLLGPGLPLRGSCTARCTVTVSAKLGRRTLRLRSARATLPGGRARTLRVRLSRASARAVRRSRARTLVLTVRTRAAGTSTTRQTISLRLR